MARKPKGSHRAYKEWVPSVKLVEQNIIMITHAQIYGRATVFSFSLSLFWSISMRRFLQLGVWMRWTDMWGKLARKTKWQVHDFYVRHGIKSWKYYPQTENLLTSDVWFSARASSGEHMALNLGGLHRQNCGIQYLIHVERYDFQGFYRHWLENCGTCHVYYN